MLKFSVEMDELRKKINFVRNGLGNSRTDLPVMLIRFEISGSKATMLASAKDLFCRTEMRIVQAEDSEEGNFAVLGSKLVSLISQVEAEKVSFEADAENLQTQAGFLTVNFELYDGSSLKSLDAQILKAATEEGWAVNRGAFEEALGCAKSCTTINSVRPDVTHVELRQGRMLSSDGRKIMIYTHDGFIPELAFKCPATVLTPALSAVKNISAEGVQIVDSSSYYLVKGNLLEYVVGVRKIERSFPAVEGQISNTDDPTDEVNIDKNVLEAMLRGVALGLPSEEVRVELLINGSSEQKEAFLEVSALNSVGRKSHERASCGRTAQEEMKFPLSFKHLLDTLGVFKGDSVVDLMVMLKLSLLMVRDTTDAREVLTIIPFRTDKQIDDEKKEADAVEEARKAQRETDAEEAETGVALAEDVGDIDLEG